VVWRPIAEGLDAQGETVDPGHPKIGEELEVDVLRVDLDGHLPVVPGGPDPGDPREKRVPRRRGEGRGSSAADVDRSKIAAAVVPSLCPGGDLVEDAPDDPFLSFDGDGGAGEEVTVVATGTAEGNVDVESRRAHGAARYPDETGGSGRRRSAGQRIRVTR